MSTSVATARTLSLVMTFGLAALLSGGCGQSDEVQAPATTTEASSSSSSPTASPPEVTPTETTSTPPTSSTVVSVGAWCSPRGAVAVFSDGATAYCARLQYTDGSVWSYDPSLAPNPSVQQQMPSGPQIGDQCIGADIGRTAVDSYGNAIICDNYAWVLNVGQTPRHPWVDGQREWSECLESFTEDECREMLNPTG